MKEDRAVEAIDGLLEKNRGLREALRLAYAWMGKAPRYKDEKEHFLSALAEVRGFLSPPSSPDGAEGVMDTASCQHEEEWVQVMKLFDNGAFCICKKCKKIGEVHIT